VGGFNTEIVEVIEGEVLILAAVRKYVCNKHYRSIKMSLHRSFSCKSEDVVTGTLQIEVSAFLPKRNSNR